MKRPLRPLAALLLAAALLPGAAALAGTASASAEPGHPTPRSTPAKPAPAKPALAKTVAARTPASWNEPVRLDSGPVTGFVDPPRGQDAGSNIGPVVHAFLGIPYAAPPVGELRWRPPAPPAPWTAPRACTSFGPGCPQPRQREGRAFSEDCLTVNVWSPAASPGERLPVMVWIHGGGFNFGATADPEYQGRTLASQGVVVVTLNYRLGPLGFLAHPALDRESPEKTSGNYGTRDQIAALAWVRANIAGFGGNPDNVTLFGQSAGSRSVSLLLTAPGAAGLFHKAIAQSGGPILGSEHLNPVFNGDPATLKAMGAVLAQRLGCGQAKDPLSCMRAKSAREVVDTAACTTSIFEEGLFFAPMLDGRVLPKDPPAAMAAGRQAQVPVMTGSTANEGTIYLRGVSGLGPADYQRLLTARFGERTGQALAVFPLGTSQPNGGQNVNRAIDRFITVAVNEQPARFTARAAASRGLSSWLFRFTRAPATDLARELGAHHGVDLAYVFGNLDPAGAYDATDRDLSRAVMGYWVNFARTGNPNGPGLPDWPSLNEAPDAWMDFGNTPTVRPHPDVRECDFMDGQWPLRRRPITAFVN